ncbi:unnamed protein product [Clavelina lepadiformis]|uniref:Uncharacterized protein n=1 Tax=Clavelina lepadiformis TaxID=159417 RepID=A0ABP0GW36_CLALP
MPWKNLDNWRHRCATSGKKKRFDWEIQLLGSTIVVQVIEVQSEVAHSDMGNNRVVDPSLPHLLYTQSAANKLQEI